MSGGLWLETAWVEMCRDGGRDFGQIQTGSTGWGLGWRQCGSIGRSLGRERRLWRINYLHMKKSAMVGGNNYVS